MKQFGALLEAIEAAAVQVRRIRMTPPVDDDFPQVKFEFDQSVRQLRDVMKEGGWFDGAQIS